MTTLDWFMASAAVVWWMTVLYYVALWLYRLIPGGRVKRMLAAKRRYQEEIRKDGALSYALTFDLYYEMSKDLSLLSLAIQRDAIDQRIRDLYDEEHQREMVEA